MGGAVWIDVVGAVQRGCRLLDSSPCLDSRHFGRCANFALAAVADPRCGAEGEEGGAGKGMDEQDGLTRTSEALACAELKRARWCGGWA